MSGIGYTIARLRLTANLPAEYLNVQTTVTREECAALVAEFERLRALVEGAFIEATTYNDTFVPPEKVQRWWDGSLIRKALDP